MMKLLAEHFRCYQHHATRTDMETFRILLQVFSDHRAVRDIAPLVNDRLGDSAIPANLDIGQGHDVLQHRIGIDPYI